MPYLVLKARENGAPLGQPIPAGRFLALSSLMCSTGYSSLSCLRIGNGN